MESPFLDACRRKKVERTPVWFMRQAGRYLPSYRKLRAEKGILEIAKDPELASNVTVDPVRQLGVDAAVIFADIMLPLEGIGVKLRIEENLGPVIENPIRTKKDVEALGTFDPGHHVDYVMEAIRRAITKLDGVPLIGFSGAPFTLASYLIEGSPNREFTQTKKLMYTEPETWRSLMDTLTKLVVDYLRAQVRSGANAVQLFDSWAGSLSPGDYERFVLPHTKKINSSIEAVPKIHFCADSSALLERFQLTRPDVLSVDWRVPISKVWERCGDDIAVQGNLDPVLALTGGKEMIKQTSEILAEAADHRGYIFNLGHGVLKETPPENLRALVKMVHQSAGKGA